MMSVTGKKGSTKSGRRFRDRSPGKPIAGAFVSLASSINIAQEESDLISAYKAGNGIPLYAMSFDVDAVELTCGEAIFEAKSKA
jgi:hypothetical protein